MARRFRWRGMTDEGGQRPTYPAAGKPPMVILGAMMRKLVRVVFGVLNSWQPFKPALHGA